MKTNIDPFSFIEDWEEEDSLSFRELTWKTATGVEIKIKDLETDHIKNIISFVERINYKSRIDQLDALKEELKYRGVKLRTSRRDRRKKKNRLSL